MNAVPHKSRDGKPVTIFHFPDLRWRKNSTPPVGDQACFGGFTPGVHSRPAASDGGPRVGWGPFLTAAVALAVLIASVCLSACTVVTGNRTAGTFTYASVAGNAKFGQLGPDGMQNGEIDNATGAGVIERTAEKVGKAYAWGKFWDFASDGLSAAENIVSDNNETDVKINANNNATKESIKTFVPPEPVSEP